MDKGVKGMKGGKASKAPRPAVVYPAGFFTEPARAWGVVSPAMLEGLPADVVQQRQRDSNTRRSRDVALATGNGWANGTIVLDGAPKHPKPIWLVRAPNGRPAKPQRG